MRDGIREQGRGLGIGDKGHEETKRGMDKIDHEMVIWGMALTTPSLSIYIISIRVGENGLLYPPKTMFVITT